MAIQDATVQLGKKAVAHADLVFVALDNDSLSLTENEDLQRLLHVEDADAESRRALELMASAWPWSREVHALVLNRLIQAGARGVIFDLNFPTPSPNDRPLAEALEQWRDRVTIVGNFAEDERGWPRFSPPAPSLIPVSFSRDARIGFANFWPDFDGIVRRAAYRWKLDYGVWQTDEELSLVARTAQQLGWERVIPPGHDRHRIRFAGAAGTFPQVPIFRIFAPEYWKRNYQNGESSAGKS